MGFFFVQAFMVLFIAFSGFVPFRCTDRCACLGTADLHSSHLLPRVPPSGTTRGTVLRGSLATRSTTSFFSMQRCLLLLALLPPLTGAAHFDRIGEADVPGPPPGTLRLTTSNPSGLRGKEAHLIGLGPGVHCLSETQLSFVLHHSASMSGYAPASSWAELKTLAVCRGSSSRLPHGISLGRHLGWSPYYFRCSVPEAFSALAMPGE